MPLKKIDSSKPKICKNPEHNPPMHIYLGPGDYEYKCPECGHMQIIHIPEIDFTQWACTDSPYTTRFSQ